MKSIEKINLVLRVFIILPIFYYLVHYVLIKIDAGELQMFLFYVYLPIVIFCALISHWR